MDEATLCHVVEGDEALLIWKKRGVGSDQWNAAGGKVEPGETAHECAVRETREETGIEPRGVEKAGVFDYYSDDWDARVHVYRATDHAGEPRESDEARPRWFPVDDLPLDEMWATDRHWVPTVLDGGTFYAEFVYRDGEPARVDVDRGVDPDDAAPPLDEATRRASVE